MRGQNAGTMTPLIRRPMAAEHFSQFNHADGLVRKSGVEFFQGLKGFFFTRRRQVGVNDRGVE